MNTKLLNKQFSYNEVRGMLGAALVKAGALTGANGSWQFEFDQDVPGINGTTKYPSINDAVDAVTPIFFNEHSTILKAAA